MSAGAAGGSPTRLQRAFEHLRQEGRLLVVENCACCSTCAHAECQEKLYGEKDKVGYLFFHAQDLDLAADAGVLWLGHSARDGMPDNVPPLVATQMLRDQGLEVEWNGDVGRRIKVVLPEGPERAYIERMREDEYENIGW